MNATAQKLLTSADFEQLKTRLKSTWMTGDYDVFARYMEKDAEVFYQRLGIAPGTRLLDVACGAGQIALIAARAGAEVTGCDIATNWIDQARLRAAAEGLKITFEEGDAEALPYEDGQFDAVVSMFGAMFAPQHELVIAECARVLKPGGLLAMANWTPASLPGRMFHVTGRHAGTALGVTPPVHWGHPMVVRGRLAPSFEKVELDLINMPVDFPGSPREAVMFFRTFFGPTQAAFDSLDEAGQAHLAADLESLWAEGNTAPDPLARTMIENEYLQVVARRK